MTQDPIELAISELEYALGSPRNDDGTLWIRGGLESLEHVVERVLAALRALPDQTADVEALKRDWRFMSEIEMAFIDGYSGCKIVDYASNPRTVRGLCKVIDHLSRTGRLAVKKEGV